MRKEPGDEARFHCTSTVHSIITGTRYYFKMASSEPKKSSLRKKKAVARHRLPYSDSESSIKRSESNSKIHAAMESRSDTLIQQRRHSDGSQLKLPKIHCESLTKQGNRSSITWLNLPPGGTEGAESHRSSRSNLSTSSSWGSISSQYTYDDEDDSAGSHNQSKNPIEFPNLLQPLRERPEVPSPVQKGDDSAHSHSNITAELPIAQETPEVPSLVQQPEASAPWPFHSNRDPTPSELFHSTVLLELRRRVYHTKRHTQLKRQ